MELRTKDDECVVSRSTLQEGETAERESHYSIQRLCKCRMQINWELLLFISRSVHSYQVDENKLLASAGNFVSFAAALSPFFTFHAWKVKSTVVLPPSGFPEEHPGPKLLPRSVSRIRIYFFSFEFSFHSSASLFRTDKIKQK